MNRDDYIPSRSKKRILIGGTPIDEGLLSRPDTKAERLQRGCLQLIAEHERAGSLLVGDSLLSTIPTNGRFLFYELEQRGLMPKAYVDEYGKKRPRQPKDDISDALMHLREKGIVPWDWIEDERRNVSVWRYSPTAKLYLLDTLPSIRIDCWKGKPPPLVICESGATAGVLERIASHYLVPITATHGQCGGFLVTDVAPLLRDDDRKVIYIGDCEFRGPADQIEANTKQYIEEHAYRYFDEDSWTKIALTQEQVDADPRLHRLAKQKLDRRNRPPKPYEAVECEAVGQSVLQQLLIDPLDALLPEPIQHVLAREARQRAAIENALHKLNGGKR